MGKGAGAVENNRRSSACSNDACDHCRKDTFMSLPLSENRFVRQVAVPEFGEATQELVASATIALVGCGALGGLQAELLARMGVGELRLADFDVVSLMNLHRQILYTEQDVATQKSKIEAAVDHLRRVNSAVRLKARSEKITLENLDEYLSGATMVLDATDNSETRFLINDWCVIHQIPWIYTGVSGTAGLVFSIVPGGPCLRCLYPEPPAPEDMAHPNTGGVLSTTVAMAVSLQVTQLLRILNKTVQPGELIRFNVWNPALRTIKVPQNPACACCGKSHETI
jgi:adenylyltransferase/sulfurtransferase